MELQDITAIQTKHFPDMLSYMAHKFRPKTILCAGLDPKAIHALVKYNCGSEIKESKWKEKEEVVVDGERKEIETDKREIEKKYDENVQIEKLICIKSQGDDIAGVEEQAKQAGFKGEIEWIDNNFKAIVRRRVFGEGLPDDVEADWEDLEFDMIAIDWMRWQGDLSGLQWSFSRMFGGLMAMNGTKTKPDLFYGTFGDYAGSCICVVSTAGEGSCCLIREQLVL